jgi:hypothetical protein
MSTLEAAALNAVSLINHVAVLGKTGSGKSSTSKVLLEKVVTGYRAQTSTSLRYAEPQARVCILDPIKSDWWGVTLAADGRSLGMPFVILGGPHGHVPLHKDAGAAIGELVATGKLPLSIIDMADFKMGELQHFYCDFAEAIFRKNKAPLHLVLEEAHEFAPKERSGVGAENMAVYWSKKLATGARSKGVRLMMVSHRVQSLHNAMLGSCETLIAHRLTAPADMEPVTKWLAANLSKEEAKAVAQSMSGLKNGEAWVCADGKSARQQFPRIHTFDNSKTPDGTEIDAAPPPIDHAALRALIGDAVKEAEENSVPALKARIAELEHGNSAPPPKIAQPGDVLMTEEHHQRLLNEAREGGYDAGYRNGYSVGKQHALTDAEGRLSAIIEYSANQRIIVRDSLSKIGPTAAEVQTSENDRHRAPEARQLPSTFNASLADSVGQPPPVPATPRRESMAAVGSSPLSPTARDILDVIHGAYPVSLSFDAAARRAAVSKKSSAYGKYLDQVTKSGEVVLENGRFKSRPQFAKRGAVDPRAGVDAWVSRLPPNCGKMLMAIRDARRLSREGVARAAGVSPTSSGLGSGLRELISLSLIRQRGEDAMYELEDGLQ